MKGELSERANRKVRRSARSFLPWLSSGLLAISIAVAAGCARDPLDRGDCATCTPDGESAAEATLETSRFPRLSHLQWENTVRDLFYLQEAPGLSASFTGDPLGGVFDNNESSLIVTPGLWTDYQLAAEELATLVTGDPAKLAKLIPKDAPADPAGRARAFIVELGRRAYRRPLTPAE